MSPAQELQIAPCWSPLSPLEQGYEGKRKLFRQEVVTDVFYGLGSLICRGHGSHEESCSGGSNLLTFELNRRLNIFNIFKNMMTWGGLKSNLLEEGDSRNNPRFCASSLWTLDIVECDPTTPTLYAQADLFTKCSHHKERRGNSTTQFHTSRARAAALRNGCE